MIFKYAKNKWESLQYGRWGQPETAFFDSCVLAAGIPYKDEPQHDKTNKVCTQRRLRSALASAQSDQSPRFALNG